MKEYLEKFEDFVAPTDGRDHSREYDASTHGTKGPVKITTSNVLWTNHAKFMAAAGELEGWEYNQEPNSGNMLGLSHMQSKRYRIHVRICGNSSLWLLMQSIKGYDSPFDALSLPRQPITHLISLDWPSLFFCCVVHTYQWCFGEGKPRHLAVYNSLQTHP